jgi:outer membrane protein OmpA-like peptidoglycan-associated protein
MLFLKKLSKFSPLFFAIVFAASCAPTNLQRLSQIENDLKTQGGYDSYLALEYLDYSRNLARVKDEKKSKYFARKALDVVNRKKIFPENPITWDASSDQIEGMILMQKRLETVLFTPHMKFYLPIQLAHLTYLYDCWISRESKADFRADELAQCRIRFSKLLEEVEAYIEDLKKDKQPKTAIKQLEFERFEILFDFNSFKFNDKANSDMIAILKRLEILKGDYHLLVVGNADRVGKEIYNENLAFNRADLVRNYLTKNGVPDNLIEVRSAGEDFLDIITKDGVQQQSNRMVGIYIMKGAGSFSSFPLPLIKNNIYREEIKKAQKERGL